MAPDGGPRLRFAPSPTGSLHLGNARTALVNWLIARSSGGTLVLRIEDTDTLRHVDGADAAIVGDLRWLGLDWDEGPDIGGPFAPYRQSERADHYRAAGEALVRGGGGYPCFCDPEILRTERDATRARGEAWRYSGRCAGLDAAVARRRVAAGEPAALRLRVPAIDVRFDDGLRGDTGVSAGEIDDFVVLRSDGTPTYLLAAVVDDHLMAIDHVVRGQDHLSNTPRQLMLYRALGWRAPRFTHLPLVLGADRARLSKRHGATSVAEARAGGILAEALVNYLALLGWAPPAGREVLDAAELVAAYRIADLAPTNVAFDVDKLLWINQQHLHRLPTPELLRRAQPYLEAEGLQVGDDPDQREWWADAVAMVAPACHKLDEIPDRLKSALWEVAVSGDLDGADRGLLESFLLLAEAGGLRDGAAFKAACAKVMAQTGRRGKGLFHPLRLALTGEHSGPELAQLLPLLERGAALALQPPLAGAAERLRRALAGLP